MVVGILESILSFKGSGSELLKSMFSMQGTGQLGFPQIILPIGISFFTFQAMSYVIDVYQNKAKVQKNFFDFALYVSFFPQLVAGPIVKYSDIAEQLRKRKETMDLFVSGQKRFCYGLAKKVLLANAFGELTVSTCTNRCNAVLVGDSFRLFMAEYLSKDFDHYTHIHRKCLDDSRAIEAINNADIIIVESVERLNNFLPETLDEVCEILEKK